MTGTGRARPARSRRASGNPNAAAAARAKASSAASAISAAAEHDDAARPLVDAVVRHADVGHRREALADPGGELVPAARAQEVQRHARGEQRDEQQHDRHDDREDRARRRARPRGPRRRRAAPRLPRPRAATSVIAPPAAGSTIGPHARAPNAASSRNAGTRATATGRRAALGRARRRPPLSAGQAAVLMAALAPRGAAPTRRPCARCSCRAPHRRAPRRAGTPRPEHVAVAAGDGEGRRAIEHAGHDEDPRAPRALPSAGGRREPHAVR